MTDQTPIEKEGATLTGILPAITAAMGDVQKVSKADRNKHDGYDFASIDNFLSLVNPICARHGLVILSDEVSREDFIRKGRSGDLPWMRVSFSFTVHHVSGQALPVMVRSVEVLRNGAQAYGSAQSYCLKQFLRGLFLIPTGDKDDADHRETDAGEIVRDQQQSEPQQDRQPAAPGKDEIDAAIAALSQAATLDALKAAWLSLSKPVQHVPAVEAAKDARKAKLDAPAEASIADQIGDEIPY